MIFKQATSDQFDNNSVTLFTNDNEVTIQSSISKIESIIVYDITGRTILMTSGINDNETKINSLLKNNQTLLVKVNLVNGISLNKKLIF